MRTTSLVVVVTLLLTLQPVRAADDKKDNQAALDAVKKKLADVKGGELLALQALSGDALGRVFPGQAFVSGNVPQFPVGRSLPKDAEIKYRNLFVVKDDKVEMFTD